MKAFHADPKVKKTYLARVMAHAKADEIVKGKYWIGGKGCAVGCTIHSSNHASYETELGIPEWLARVEDTLFEGMSDKVAKTWPARFLKAINPGADLEKAKVPFLILVLKDSLKSLGLVEFDAKKFPQVADAIAQSKAAVKQMILAQRARNEIQIKAARSAAYSAYSAAYSAADSAADSAARSAAYSAADSAACSADSAADSAAYSAADSAAYSACSADSAAYSAAYEKYAVGLLKILRGIKK